MKTVPKSDIERNRGESTDGKDQRADDQRDQRGEQDQVPKAKTSPAEGADQSDDRSKGSWARAEARREGLGMYTMWDILPG